MVIAEGETLCVPLAATAPMPLSMVTVSAPVLVQFSVELPPETMEAGTADRVTVGNGTTVIVTLSVTVPPAPVAVIV